MRYVVQLAMVVETISERLSETSRGRILSLCRVILRRGQLLPALDHVELAWHKASKAGTNKGGALVITGERKVGKFFSYVYSPQHVLASVR